MIFENQLRKLYYRLTPSIRLLARKLFYLPKDIFRDKNLLQPPEGLIYTGRGDFIKVGKYWKERFIKDGFLMPEHNVLDIGSGIGRMALPLTTYLTSGKYEGFDAVYQGVKWCKENIQSQYPHFNFQYIDLSNDLYKGNGIDPSTYSFLFEKEYFDFIFAISVFTHLIDSELENYIKQSARVIKKNGILFATFFIVSDDYTPNNQRFNFPHDFGHFLLMDKVVQSANVAYRFDYLQRLFNQSGFTIELYEKGYWQENIPHNNNDFQDLLIVRKN